MAIVANTFTTFDAKGIREELANTIASISPEETPFQSNVGSESVSNTFFEWQTDELAAQVQLQRLLVCHLGSHPTSTKLATRLQQLATVQTHAQPVQHATSLRRC